MLDVEVIGSALPPERVRQAVELAVASAGVEDGHVAVAFVSEDRMVSLNALHRGLAEPTDVLSFPMDGDEALAGPAGLRELGDVVICPEHTEDLTEAVLHGTLHLMGMDHETDEGEMLVLQAELRGWLRDE